MTAPVRTFLTILRVPTGTLAATLAPAIRRHRAFRAAL